MEGSADYIQPIWSEGGEGSQGRVGERGMEEHGGSGTVALPPVCLRCRKVAGPSSMPV